MMLLFYFSLFGAFLFKKNLQLDFKQDKLFHMKHSLSYRCVFHVKQRGKMEKQIIASIEKAETDLKHYLDLLNNWQKAVNLISSSTLETAWHRHIVDSAQLYPLIPNTASSLVDMGSGAGFPGLVLAILNKANNGFLKDIFLVESDLKKCLFLKEVSRQLSVPVTVLIICSRYRVKSTFGNTFKHICRCGDGAGFGAFRTTVAMGKIVYNTPYNLFIFKRRKQYIRTVRLFCFLSC